MTTRSASRRSGWVALGVTALARMLLTVLASLALWAVAPAALGLHSTVVMTGSMLPRLVPGDIVLSRTVPADQLQLGQTLLFPDPDQPGHLRLHRWVDVAPDGRMVTKGDANPANDSTTITRADVVGVASIRVPYLGRPVVWVADGNPGQLVLVVVALLVVIGAAFWFRAADEDDDQVEPGDAAPPATGDDPTAPADDLNDRRWPRRLVQTGVALLAVTGLGLGYAATADAAPFSRATANPTDSWSGATYFSCAAGARAAGARFTWPLSESGGTTANDVTTNNVDGTYSGGVTYNVAGPCRTDDLTGVTLNGTSGTVAASLAADSIPELTMQIWFKSAPTGRGGVLMSFTATSGFIFTTDTTSMAVAMTTAGAITFAVGSRKITGTTNYRDNGWHQLTAVAGSSGMYLYVDGATAASTTTSTPTTSVTGTPRVGYGDASDLATGSYDYYAGSVAFASVYKSALPAGTVLAQYQAATP